MFYLETYKYQNRRKEFKFRSSPGRIRHNMADSVRFWQNPYQTAEPRNGPTDLISCLERQKLLKVFIK